jgi:hypothetical protein
MNDRLTRVESTVRDLEAALARVEGRMQAIERALAGVAPGGSSSAVRAPFAEAAPPPASTSTTLNAPAVKRDDVVSVLTWIGRSLVVMGGAYLLRALTDSGILPRPAGIALGLAYALVWLAAADRAAGRGARLSAALHQVVASMIGFPILWEATVHFNVLTPPQTAVAIGVVTAVELGVALRRRLQPLAWIAVGFALATALALIAATGVVVPFALFLIAFGIATLWIGYAVDWVWLRWPVALGADVAVLALTLRVSSRSWGESPGRVVAVQLLLLTGYLASIAVRTLVRARDVNAFEVLQSTAALAVGFGGAVYVAHLTASGVTALALINLVFGAGGYGVAFVFVAERQGLRRNFYFYTSLALVLVLVSSTLLVDDGRLAITCGLLAIVTSGVAWRIGRVALNLHAAVYTIVAGVAGGLLPAATGALVGPAALARVSFDAAALAVLAGAGLAWMIPMPSHADWGAYSRVPRVLLAAVFVWALGGWAVTLGAATATTGADAGVIATVRTVVLAVAALGLAWLGRHERFRESGWLLYPVLVAGGLKLLFDDFPHSDPSTLFVALALYGGALIAAPRLARRAA